jgi:hypothetical protein
MNEKRSWLMFFSSLIKTSSVCLLAYLRIKGTSSEEITVFLFVALFISWYMLYYSKK